MRCVPACIGDIVVVADVGAYTLSMWSRYNSRCSPPVYGFSISAASALHATGDDGTTELQPVVTLETWRPAESMDDMLAFWG